jgi:inner membrane protein
MSDTSATPPLPGPAAVIIAKEPGFFRLMFEYLRGDSLMARALVLLGLTLLLNLPLSLVGHVIDDRQRYENEAVINVTESWGRDQTFSGPMLVLPYTVVVDKSNVTHTLTLLPERLSINGQVTPTQRRRGLFAITVYTAALDVTAEFHPRDLEQFLTSNETADWSGARLVVGLSDPTSIDASSVNVDGHEIAWMADGASVLSSIKAALGGQDIGGKETVSVTFKLSAGGSSALSFTPLGQRTDVAVASTWQSPGFTGRYLPATQSVDESGMRAHWTTSHLGRRYGQVWDSGVTGSAPTATVVLESAFGFTLINPIDAYRETDRAIKYAIMIIGLTFTVCLLFEMATGTRPSIAQYGLIGLSLCVFYLLLLSFSEQIGFAPAFIVSAAAVVAQASAYNWAVHRRIVPALIFGAVLGGLFGGLYTLLQLADVALLSGSVLLFLVLSLAMWFTRNLHRANA